MRLFVPPDYPNRVKHLRTRFGLTQTHLAELMGVAPSAVNRWGSG